MTQPPASRPQLSLIIPAYNESESIASALEVACGYLEDQDLAFEVLVVDDGSLDDTPIQAQQFSDRCSQVRLVRHPANLGKGAAVRTGMMHGSGDLLIFTDADMSYAIEDIGTMITILRRGADVAIGSRALKESLTLRRPPMLRSLFSQVFSLAVQLIAIRGVADTQCGFKGFRRQAAVDIFRRLTISGFAFDVELLVIAQSLGYKIELVPVHYVARETSKVHVFQDSLRMLTQLFRIRANKESGVYTRVNLGEQAAKDISRPREEN